MGLGTTNVGDYFVLTSVHDPAMRAVQLESYLCMVKNLLEESLPHIKDIKTRQFISVEISTIQKTKHNVGEIFFSEAKTALKTGVGLIWPKDFPTIKILNAKETTVRLFAPTEVDFFLKKKKEAEEAIAAQCNIYNPTLLIAISTLQMQFAITNTNPEFAEFFNNEWTGEKDRRELVEKLATKMLKEGIRKFEIGMMNETYRQMVLSGVDLQRALRERLFECCSKGKGEVTLFSEYELLKLFENLFTIFCIDWIENMMTELKMPVFILENEYVSIFVPLMSEMEPLPFQKGLNDRQNRLLFQYVSSRATNEEKIPQWQFFIQSLSEFERKQLHFLIYYLTEGAKLPIVIFPETSANEIFGGKDLPEELVFEWINGPKSPFVKVKFKDENYYVATRMIVEDKLFRIMWVAHQGNHIRIRGTKFEDFILDVLKKQFPDELTYKNKYFFTEEGKRNRYEIDRTFVLNELFFIVECKNLLLIEDTANFRKLRSRNQELKKYGEYLELKATLLKDNFEQLEEEIPQLSKHKCTRVIPVILSLYPDILTFYKVPFLSIYEFIRYVTACEAKKSLLDSYTDVSQITFQFPSYEIHRKKPQ
jgi:hypothetical protein